jgi:cholesterol transport system auxiliary component
MEYKKRFSAQNMSLPFRTRMRAFIVWPAMILLLLMGCVAGGKAPIVIDQYILEYPPPVLEGLQPLNQTVSVGRFAVAQAFNTPMMVYRTGPYEYYTDYYNRWRVNPGDMVTDYLLRDLKRSGLFKAVFSYRDTEDARFLIQGNIEDFLGSREGGRNEAILTVYITLLDTSQTEVTKKVVFQKRYRHVRILDNDSAVSLAKGMSEAMEVVSKEALKDIVTSAGRFKP